EAFAAGKDSPLPELPIQYADYAVWQRARWQRDVVETHLRFWKQQLEGVPHLLELPTDRPRAPVQTFRGAQQAFVLPKELSERVKALSQFEGATPFMTLLAAFQVLLSRYSGQDQIVVSTGVANRDHCETWPLIG